MNKKLDVKLVEELQNLNTRITDVETMVREEGKAKLKLRHEAESRLEQLAKMEESEKSMKEKHHWEKMGIIRKITSAEEYWRLRKEEIAESMDDRNEEIAGYSVVESQMDMYHTKFKKLSKEYYSETEKWNTEITESKERNFDLRMKMDKILRGTTKELRKGYKSRAVALMQAEATQAGSDNEKLQRDRNSKILKCDRLMVEQQEGFDKKVKAHIEMEVMSTSTALHTQHVKNLENRYRSVIERLNHIQMEYFKYQEESVKLKDDLELKMLLASKLEDQAEIVDKMRKKRDDLRSETIDMIQKMIDSAISSTKQQRESENEILLHTVLDTTNTDESKTSTSITILKSEKVIEEGDKKNKVDVDNTFFEAKDNDSNSVSDDRRMRALDTSSTMIDNLNTLDTASLNNNFEFDKIPRDMNFKSTASGLPSYDPQVDMDLIWKSNRAFLSYSAPIQAVRNLRTSTDSNIGNGNQNLNRTYR